MNDRSAGQGQRLVVDLVGDREHGQVAESRFVDRPFLPGGEHNMYELAFAASVLGYEVELRGWLDQRTFTKLAEATGAAPKVRMAARQPEAEDLLVVPEGWRDPLEYARVLLSPAQPVLYVLAATGLFGWPFTREWERPDPLTVDLGAVGRAEHLAAAAGLGFRLITHSPGVLAVAEEAGVDCRFLGTGRPGWTAPPPADKQVDVAVLTENRWAPLAERVLAALPAEITRDRIERAPNEVILERLARARILIWPSRVEGHATIPWEARSVGCVPVALDTNRFAVGLAPDRGAVLVHSVDELGAATVELLRDPSRWETLSERARATAPGEVDWESFLGRVQSFLESARGPDPTAEARAGMGVALGDWINALKETDHGTRLELAVAKRDLTAATENQIALTAQLRAAQSRRGAWRDQAGRVKRGLERLADYRNGEGPGGR